MKKSSIDGFQGAAFGFMDNSILVLSLLIGVAVATDSTRLAIIAGLIGAIANAFSNSIGFYASELAERGEQIKLKIRRHTHREIKISSLYAFIASLVMLLPIIPFFYFGIITSIKMAFLIVAVVLYSVGYRVGKASEIKNPHKYGVMYVLMAAFGAIVSFSIGHLLKIYL